MVKKIRVIDETSDAEETTKTGDRDMMELGKDHGLEFCAKTRKSYEDG